MRAVKVWSSAVLAIVLMAAAAFGQDNVEVGSPADTPAATLAGDQNGDDSNTNALLAAENSIWVTDVNGAVNGTSTMRIKATSDQDIYAIQFTVVFDQTILQIPDGGVSVGNDATALSLPATDAEAITAANSSGKLVVYLLDLNSDPRRNSG